MEDLARRAVEGFLGKVREEVNYQGLNRYRLPGWIASAKVRVARTCDTFIIVVEDNEPSGTHDHFCYIGDVGADVVALLGSSTQDFVPRGAMFDSPPGGAMLVNPHYPEPVNIALPPYTAFLGCGYEESFQPHFLVNLLFHVFDKGADTPPSVVRFIPLGIYVHVSDITPETRMWDLCGGYLMEMLTAFANPAHNLVDAHGKSASLSDVGDAYAEQNARVQIIADIKKNHVIVLGSYKYVQELIKVRDYLSSEGYTAYLIKDLPDIPGMSLQDKVRLWGLSSRFCIMVDQDPAGHYVEYEILKQQFTTLAVLRPSTGGSSYMFGHEEIADVNFIKSFQFEHNPLDALPQAVSWAEEFFHQRTKAYQQVYPWLQQGSE